MTKLLCVLCLFVAIVLPANMLAPAKWRLVWSDEFDYTGLPDPAKWGYDVGGHGWGNKELQYYTERRKENARVENGRLIIEARRDNWEAHEYTSARLVTKNKGDWTYGRVEVRAKLPSGRGTWPAIWMLPTSKDYGGWPSGGEIDIMEHVGESAWTSVALHGPGYFGDTPLVRRVPAQDVSAWHEYSVDWTEDTLVFRVDGREAYRVTKAMVERHGKWAFDNPKFLILNLALGGGYPQSVNHAEAPYPGLPEATVRAIKNDEARILVDWVRVTATDKGHR